MAATAQSEPRNRRRPSPYRVLIYYFAVLIVLIGISLWDTEDVYSVPLACVSVCVVAVSYVHVVHEARRETVRDMERYQIYKEEIERRKKQRSD